MQGDDDVLKDANINDFEDEPDVTADVLIDYADDAMVPALPCSYIILFSLETSFRLYHVLNCPSIISCLKSKWHAPRQRQWRQKNLSWIHVYFVIYV